MKKLIIFAMVCLIASLAQAQLKVKPSGYTMLGDNPFEDGTDFFYDDIRDTTTMLKVYGPGIHGSNARISFGDQYYNLSKNVLVGESGESDTDQLWLHGKKGFVFTINRNASDSIISFKPLEENVINVSVPIRSTQYLTASDSRFKENVQSVDDALATISALNGVSYNLRSRNIANSRSTSAPIADPTGIIAQDDALFEQYYSKIDDATHYGFIAQEVEDVLPELVYTDPNGYKYVDYISVIPLLVNAVHQLQGELAEVKGEQRGGSVPMKSQAVAGIDEQTAGLVVPALYQNIPNPFSEDTNIRYTLPETVQQATLFIYDMQGKQVKSIPVNERGSSSVTIQGSELAAGMYIYALIADGKEIASKRMILTK